MLSNGSIEESVVDYSCNPNYYLVNENANVRFSCELGAMWEPKKLISCIKGLCKIYLKIFKMLSLKTKFFQLPKCFIFSYSL